MAKGSAAPLRKDRFGKALTSLAAGSLALSLVLILGLLVLIASHGLGFFWQGPLVQLEQASGPPALGEVWGTEQVELEAGPVSRTRLKVGNRDLYGLDFRWVADAEISTRSRPRDAVLLERLEWGDFFGYFESLQTDALTLDDPQAIAEALPQLLEQKAAQRAAIRHLERVRIGRVNSALERLRLDQRRIEMRLHGDSSDTSALAEISSTIAERQADYETLVGELGSLRREFERETLRMRTADGRSKALPVAHVLRVIYPNQISTLEKLGLYVSRSWEFVSGEPRESNTEGGIFPAIFGTVMMVLLMSVAVVPFGVLAAVYMHEYAREGLLLRIVRIAVNNLAGVPSIVFGVFGLGFFVYFVGGGIDQLFFPESLPTPTYGTGGILWASLTLALLTVPVVIVATEEGLSAVPRAIREGSLALGATRWETIQRVVLPATVPGILTGVILAIGRAAGEVAPLMIVGMVKLAPNLPFDGEFPFIHLERKFMHMGFHIYDLAFQSPNVEAVKPLVFAAAFLLLLVVLSTNIAAILLRNYLRRRYATSSV
jgi:phosphate transport system permease protein